MLLITVVSVRHIHNNSKIIESIGIRTDSKLMRAYLVCWIGVNVFAMADFLLCWFILVEYWEFDRDGGSNFYRQEKNLLIAEASVFIVMYIFLTLQNSLILLAYYRLAKNLSSQQKKLVADTLRKESISKQRGPADATESFS